MTTLRVNKYGAMQRYFTIQQAIDHANSGDKIIVDSDVYSESVHVNKNDITIEGLLPASGKSCSINAPKIIGGGLNTAFVLDSVSNVCIRGFNIENFGYAVVINNSTNITIENNLMFSIVNTPILSQNSTGITIQENNIIGYGNVNNAIELRNCSNSNIQENGISSMFDVGGAVALFHDNGSFSHNSIVHNFIHMNGNGIGILSTNNSSNVSNMTIQNNIVTAKSLSIWVHKENDQSMYNNGLIESNTCSSSIVNPDDNNVSFYYNGDSAIFNTSSLLYTVEKYSDRLTRIWNGNDFVETYASEIVFTDLIVNVDDLETCVLMKTNITGNIILNRLLFTEKFLGKFEPILSVILIYVDDDQKKVYATFSGQNSTMISNVIGKQNLSIQSILIEQNGSKIRIHNRDLTPDEWNLTV